MVNPSLQRLRAARVRGMLRGVGIEKEPNGTANVQGAVEMRYMRRKHNRTGGGGRGR